MSERFVNIAIPRPLDQLFTYRLPEGSEEGIVKGNWVTVPFGRSQTHGYVAGPILERDALPTGIKVEKIKKIADAGPASERLPEDVWSLCEWASRYYQAPLGEVLGTAFPISAIRKKKPKKAKGVEVLESVALSLTAEQTEVFQKTRELYEKTKSDGRSSTLLLEGVTGSGKTEIYIELARQVLKEGRSILVLVPEIALTPQLTERFSSRLGQEVGVWHSAMAAGARYQIWKRILQGEVRVVLGARSAVFAPIQSLGLIIIDEEHDPTYKQDHRFRYQARDLALVRAKAAGVFTVLGSATPSFESLRNAQLGRYAHLKLLQRPGTAQLPSVEFVDLGREALVSTTQAPFAERTLSEIQKTLQNGEQVMVYLNRRGFAATLLCRDCRWVSKCHQCSVSLTVHRRSGKVICHTCGHQEHLPDLCPKCQSHELILLGAGTESLEEDLPKLIPEMKPIRLDRDQITSVGRLEKVLDDFRSGQHNTLLGTQMLVKGHDFPGVTLVVVVLADSLFRWPDFRAPERALQVLKQVSGRAGRAKKPGKVLIQTFDPEAMVLKALEGPENEKHFLEEEMNLRQALSYPPFGRLGRLRLSGKDRSDVVSVSRSVAEHLEAQAALVGAQVLGPSEAFLEQVMGEFRWEILIKGSDVGAVQKAVRIARNMNLKDGISLSVDIDPVGMV